MTDGSAPGGDAVDPGLIASIRSNLEGLKRTRDGEVLYMLIERGLKRYGAPDGHIEHAFIGFLHALLTRCAADPKYSPATRVKARLMEKRLALYLPEDAAATSESPAPAPVVTPAPASAQVPLAKPAAASDATGTSGVAGPAAEPPRVSRTPAPAVPESLSAAPPVKEKRSAPVTHRPAPSPATTEAEAPPAHPEVEALAIRMADSLAAEPLNALEAAGHKAMDRLDTAIRDFKDLKHLLVRGLDDLIREREDLKQRLASTAEYMKSLEEDRSRLRQELAHARKHSLLDELTGLPRRDVFERSLEAEIARVKRYGFAVAIALIDVDRLGSVNEKHGRDAGDAVLRCYAAEILSNFRSYDLVARYEDDSFAVLFPNTQREGAQRALEKAQKRAGETIMSHAGRSLPLPSFSSVLTMYSPGEKPAALLKRAAEALDRARLQGPRQSVTALHSA